MLQLTSFESEAAHVLSSENSSAAGTDAKDDAGDANESVSLLNNRRQPRPHNAWWWCVCYCCRCLCGSDPTDDDSDNKNTESKYEIDDDAYFTSTNNADSMPS